MTSQYTISLYYVVYFGFVMFYTGSNINDFNVHSFLHNQKLEHYQDRRGTKANIRCVVISNNRCSNIVQALLSFEIINSIFTQIVEQYDLIVMGVTIWWNSLALKRTNIEIFNITLPLLVSLRLCQIKHWLTTQILKQTKISTILKIPYV